jgi:hypothetical protein
MVMDADKVLELTGLTYGQLNYLVKRVDALNRDKTQGKARKFTLRQAVYLKVASMMRADGIRISEVNQALSVLDEFWMGWAGQGGALVRTGDKNNPWAYALTPNFVIIDPKDKTVKQSKRVARVSGFLYDVEYQASKLRGDNQLELDLEFDESELSPEQIQDRLDFVRDHPYNPGESEVLSSD